LVKRIYEAADALQQRNPNWKCSASHLGVHPNVADVLIAKAQEAVEGRAAMNCSLCKYRVQIVGFEQQVGEPQRPHHLQVRGLFEKASITETATEFAPYVPHPIEVKSFRIIAAGRDWPDPAKRALWRVYDILIQALL
jgi:precorrin-8X/cobalt-precorrin-8 methylmutase